MAKVSRRARDRPRRCGGGQIFQMFSMRLPAASLKFRDGDRLIIVNKIVEYGSRCTHNMRSR